MANYLVTGGAGFIGSHLCESLLAEGHAVRVLDDLSTGKRDNLPPEVEFIEASIVDRAALEAAMAGTDGCFHLAAIASVQRSTEDWLGTHQVNLVGTIAVLDAARRLGGVPVVYASSAAVYGDNPALPLAETAETRPLSAYGADKLGSELHARVATLVHGVPTTGFRFFNVFGPRQDPKSPYSGVISIFIERLLSGQSVMVFGDGRQTRDFIFVGDVVSHLVAAMAQPTGQPRVFNVCTGRETSLLDLISALELVIGTKSEISFQPPRPGDIRASLGSPALATMALGVTASTALIDGLRVTIASQR